MIDCEIKITGGGYIAEISPRLGATCFRLYHLKTGAELLRTPNSEDERARTPFLFGNPILFPPNRIRNGAFEFDGREYRFPINEPETGCHLHGELWNTAFSVESLQADGAVLTFSAECGEYIGFPHSFTIKREYSLDCGGLSERTVIVNRSPSKMPVMLAFHTTFNLPFAPYSEGNAVRAKIAVERELFRNRSYLPTGEWLCDGEREKALRCGEYAPCGKALSAFYKTTEPTAFLYDDDSECGIKYFADDEYGYRMLWSASDGNFFVLEPQTCAVDCFHLPTSPLKNGLIVLQPRAKKVLTTKIGLA